MRIAIIMMAIGLLSGCRYSTPTVESSSAITDKQKERRMQTQIMKEADKVWLEGTWDSAYPRKESTVHWAQSAIMRNIGEDVTYEYLMGV
jgi:hypothetical protein